jgi:uncharacterized protein (TIGR03067 family)
MKVRIAWLTALTLLGLATESGSQAQDAKKGVPELQGTWTIVDVQDHGESVPFPGNLPRWVIKGNKVYYGGEVLAVLTAFPDSTPRGIDLTFTKNDRTYEAIYAFEGDQLKLCINRQDDGVKERPGEFGTKDKPGLRLFVLKREKAGADDGTKTAPGFLGIQIRFDEEAMQVIIQDFVPKSPAAKSDLKKNDGVLKVGSTAVSDLKSTIELVQQARPGTDLTLRVRRGDKELDVVVRVGAIPFFLLDR